MIRFNFAACSVTCLALFILGLCPLDAHAQAFSVEDEFQKAASALEAGDLEEASRRLTLVMAVDSTYLPAIIASAATDMQLQRFGSALKNADRGLAMDQDHGALLHIAAEAGLMTGQVRKPLRHYRTLETLIKQRKVETPPMAQVRYRIGSILQNIAASQIQKGDFTSATESLESAAGYLPDSLSIRIDLGTLYLKQNRDRDALKLARSALVDFPWSVDLVERKAAALGRLGQTDELIETVERLYRLKDDLQTGLSLAKLLLQSNRPQRSAEVFDELLARYPREKEIYEAMMVNSERLGKHESTLAILRRMQTAFPDDPAVLKRIGSTLEKSGQYDLARAAYDSLSLEDPVQARLSRARTYLLEGDEEASKEAFAQLVRHYPKDPQVLRLAGEVAERHADWPLAEELFQRLNAQAESSYSQTRWANALVQQDRSPEAATLLDQVIERGDARAEAWHLRASSEANAESAFYFSKTALRRSFEELERMQENLLQAASSSPTGLPPDSLGSSLEQSDDFSGRVFDAFTASFPNEKTFPVLEQFARDYHTSARLLHRIGSAYLTAGEDSMAMTHLSNAVRLAPSLRAAQLSIGEAYLALDDTMGALMAFERALTLDEKAEEAYGPLVRLYRAKGELDRLCDRWLARHKADPRNQVLKSYLVEALHRAGRFDEARGLGGD